MRTRLARPVAFAVVMAVVLIFGACSGRQGELSDTDLSACDSYVSAFRECSTRTGLPLATIDQQADALRTELHGAAKDATSRTQVRARCSASERRLMEACR